MRLPLKPNPNGLKIAFSPYKLWETTLFHEFICIHIEDYAFQEPFLQSWLQYVCTDRVHSEEFLFNQKQNTLRIGLSTSQNVGHYSLLVVSIKPLKNISE